MGFGFIDASQTVKVSNTSYANSFNDTWNRAITLGNLGDINLSFGSGSAGGGVVKNWLPIAAGVVVIVGVWAWLRRT